MDYVEFKFKEVDFTASLVFCGIWLILTILSNGFLILMIGLSRPLRTSIKHCLIVVKSLAALVGGCFINGALIAGYRIEAMKSEIEVRNGSETNSLSCEVRVSTDGVAFILLSVFVLTICAIMVDYLLETKRKTRIGLVVGFTVPCWLLSFLVLLPLFFLSVGSNCIYKSIFHNVHALSYFPQATLTFFLFIAVMVAYCNSCIKKTSFPFDMLFTVWTVICLPLPYLIFSFVIEDSNYNGSNFPTLLIVKVIFIFVELSMYFIVPIIWLLADGLIRREMKKLFCGRGTVSQPINHDFNTITEAL